MKKILSLAGVYPPLPTAFDGHDELLTSKMQENIRHLNQFDLAGYLILGSNGELVMLSEAEKHEVYEKTREVIPADKIMLAGTGAQSTAETLRLLKLAQNAQADAALILNPSYYKGLMTTDALAVHYFTLADAAEIPIIIYNMPANSGMDLSADTIVKLASHQNIVGLKDSGGNLTKMAEIIDRTDDQFQVLAGSAGFLLPAMSIGAIGGILALANIAPQTCVNLFMAHAEGALEEAAVIQRSVIQLNTAVTRGWGVPALKAAMDHLGLYGGPCRMPIQALSSDKLDHLKELLQRI